MQRHNGSCVDVPWGGVVFLEDTRRGLFFRMPFHRPLEFQGMVCFLCRSDVCSASDVCRELTFSKGVAQ
jgi:hypothetical protein